MTASEESAESRGKRAMKVFMKAAANQKYSISARSEKPCNALFLWRKKKARLAYGECEKLKKARNEAVANELKREAERNVKKSQSYA